MEKGRGRAGSAQSQPPGTPSAAYLRNYAQLDAIGSQTGKARDAPLIIEDSSGEGESSGGSGSESTSDASFEILPDPLVRTRAVPEYKTALSRTAMTPPRTQAPQPAAAAPSSPSVRSASTAKTSRIKVVHPVMRRPRALQPQRTDTANRVPSPTGSLYTWLIPEAAVSSASAARAMSTSQARRAPKQEPLDIDIATLNLGESVADDISSGSTARRAARPRPSSPPRRLAPVPSASLPLFSYSDSTLPHARGIPPAVTYTASADEVEDLLGCLRGGVYGFDLEWPVWSGQARAKPKNGQAFGQMKDWQNPGKTALVQICDERMVLLIHVSMMPEFPPALRKFCENKEIFKLGVQVRGDGQKLARDSKGALLCNGLLELNNVARRVDPVGCGPGGTLISLANLSKAYLQRELDKGSVRRSDWSKRLNPVQRAYAANDVYASFLIYKALLKLASENEVDIDLADITQNLAVEKQQYDQVMQGRVRRSPTPEDGVRDVAEVEYDASEHSMAVRAYVIFSSSDKKSLEQIGRELRSNENPLAPSTVRGYILQTLLEDSDQVVENPQRVIDLIENGRTRYDPYGTFALLQRMQQQIRQS